MKKKKIKKVTEASMKDIKSPEELLKIYANEPEPIFYWRGIEDVSFGYVFGPSKAGKTIFCENLAMSLAVGRSEFFKSKLSEKPKKVFLAAMEENYRNRAKRMKAQIGGLISEEVKVYNSNMVLAGKDFPRVLETSKDWDDFESTILDIDPNVVIIDSLTRIMKDDIEKRENCKRILARMRNFAYSNGFCLILIHHSTKASGNALTMESMAGSSILSQEADFSIGLNYNQITGERYLKEVFYRYEESTEMVMSYEIDNETSWLTPLGFVYEAKILNNTGIEASNNYELIGNYLKDKADAILEKVDIDSYEIEVSELKEHFVTNSTMPSRTFSYTLKNIVNNKVLTPSGKKGNYKYLISDSGKLSNSCNIKRPEADDGRSNL